MCGIVGMISTSKKTDYLKKKNYMSTALYLDTLRGWDSTGIAGIPYDDPENVVLYKRAMPAPDFLQLKVTGRILSDLDKFSAVIGHNRAATQGLVTDPNAHPFVHDHIVLAHNGTLDKTKPGVQGQHTVDSARIAEHMVTNGEKETLEALNGAFALMWVNNQDHTFNIARNKERPLHFAFSEDEKTVFFASEVWMIDVAASKAGYKLKEESIWELGVGEWYSFDLEATKHDDYIVEEFTPYEPPKATVYNHNFNKGYKHTPSLPDRKDDKKRQQEQNLRTLGLSLGQFVTVYPTHFEPYRDKDKNVLKRGCGVGYIEEVEGYQPCHLHGVEHDEFDKYEEDGQYYGTISGIQYKDQGHGKGEWIVYISKAWRKPKSSFVEDWEAEEDVVRDLPEDFFHYEDVGAALPGPDGSFIDRKTYKEKVEDGCCMCGDPITSFDAPSLVWTEAHQPICEGCQKEAESMGLVEFTKH